MLHHPNFNKPFVIHTDASDRQLRSIISQEGKPIAYFSPMLTSAQQKYTTTDKELLSIVETLKEFHSILYGNRVEVHTDHRNLTYNNSTHQQRVLRQQLILEEYGVTLHYIKGTRNIAADALSRLPINNEKHTSNVNKKKIFEKISP